MRLYFAAPLFCASERAFNARLAEEIRALGYDVFLPQETSQDEGVTLEEMETEDWSEAIFALDSGAVFESDVVLLILDGRVPDEGVCVELGLAWANRKHTGDPSRLIGYSTDFRQFSRAGLNAMIAGALDEVLEDEESLLDRLREIFANKHLSIPE